MNRETPPSAPTLLDADTADWSQPQWDAHWMARALALAETAASLGEVPVGAVVVQDNVLLGEGFNQPILSHDPSAHAEVVALRAAAEKLNNYRLPNATLYVTLEPCAMCAGAMVHGRVSRLVYAAFEPKAGVAHSQEAFFERSYLNHRVAVENGVGAAAASQLLSRFFQQRREQKKSDKQKLIENFDAEE
ncbi:tRNA adenosine(34) deaminase TadA [Simiduia curdlanivorans]|uniref:tRNA-specific adenosine deaminase n=1 Tax=Simiduia curdlanivorans TaxID=1492769 RepID=A0ABV8V6A5_9GAMM|nr:tRNA adenosine(34) deaminase TadA [Simiduia curdlanivorans]MDN3640235.1 tRNA adenosine(34) deaminase TadA [Simiduia curdlanivorans]